MKERKYSRLTLNERRSIEQGLKARKSIKTITMELGRGNSTVVREILRNSIHKQTGGYGRAFNNCENREFCSESHLCSKEDCRREYCCGCRFCFHVCKMYKREHCLGLKRPPYVCDGCVNLRICTLEKAFYRASIAQRSADEVLSDMRKGVDLSVAEQQRLDEIISPLIRKGQSPYHICQSNKDVLMISDKTVYKYIAAGLFSAKSTDLLRKVKMKPRKSKPQIKIEKACREGRTYRDFLDYIEKYPDTEVVQMDSVIGKKGKGEKLLLTICFPQSEVMLAFIRDANTARSVTEIFETIKSGLGYNRFEEIFPLLLTDYGPEFSNPSAIETDEDGLFWTQIFYCNPNCSYQKGCIENGHRLIRMVLPKGTSMNRLSQDDIELIMSHVNSYKRKSLGGQSPIEVFARQHGNKMLTLLGVKTINPNDINLTPKLLLK